MTKLTALGRSQALRLRHELESNPDRSVQEMCDAAGLTKDQAIVMLLVEYGAYAPWMDED